MKTIYQLICALCVICGICACDDFLDTDNLTMKDTSNFPLNETDAVQMVNGIYSVMNRNLADPEEDPFFIFDIASDDRLGGGSQSNIGAQGVDRLMNAYVDWMKPLWKQRYAGINRANNALENHRQCDGVVFSGQEEPVALRDLLPPCMVLFQPRTSV